MGGNEEGADVSAQTSDDEDQIAWRFTTKKGPRHGYLKGAGWSLCSMAIWMNDQDKIDPSRRKCGLCVRVEKVRRLKGRIK